MNRTSSGGHRDRRADTPETIGLILAGGKARRLGGIDKGLLELSGRPLIEYLIDALRPQVDRLWINANRSRDRYAEYGLPVLPDRIGDFYGPLAGMAAGLAAVREQARPETPAEPLLLAVPCDSPLVPADLVERMRRALDREDAELVVAHDGHRLQPVFALLRPALLPSLEGFLAAGERKIDRWYAQHHMAVADLSDRPEAFLNVNRAEDAADLETRLAARPDEAQPYAPRTLNA